MAAGHTQEAAMKTRSRVLAAIGVVVLIGTLLAAPLQAQTAATYKVRMGTEFFSKGIPGFSNRFLPETIRVHEGDTIHFAGGAPTLLPAGAGPTEWREDNQVRPGQPWFVAEEDPDDGARNLKFNTRFFLPTRFDCGDESNPCGFSGNAVLNGGDGREFFVRIQANPGTVIYAIQLFFSRSNFRIEVVPDGVQASTQAGLDKRARARVHQDYETAAALHDKYGDRMTSHINDNGKRVWDAWAGVDNGNVSLLAMYPKNLTIEKGDLVQWHFDLESEVHDVHFPFDRAKKISENSFTPACDPDGDDGPGPDTPPTMPPPGFCDDPSQLEFDLLNGQIYPSGNHFFERARGDHESSGLRGAQALRNGFFSERPYNLKFGAASSDEGFRYFCTIHGTFMGGKVVVNRK